MPLSRLDQRMFAALARVPAALCERTRQAKACARGAPRDRRAVIARRGEDAAGGEIAIMSARIDALERFFDQCLAV